LSSLEDKKEKEEYFNVEGRVFGFQGRLEGVKVVERGRAGRRRVCGMGILRLGEFCERGGGGFLMFGIGGGIGEGAGGSSFSGQMRDCFVVMCHRGMYLLPPLLTRYVAGRSSEAIYATRALGRTLVKMFQMSLLEFSARPSSHRLIVMLIVIKTASR
jgi:hypothetical protein